ncbi:Uncharacterised protein [Bordetella pertussis]|nr:Uncharacterised protein [Bordetella pertussis]
MALSAAALSMSRRRARPTSDARASEANRA